MIHAPFLKIFYQSWMANKFFDFRRHRYMQKKSPSTSSFTTHLSVWNPTPSINYLHLSFFPWMSNIRSSSNSDTILTDVWFVNLIFKSLIRSSHKVVCWSLQNDSIVSIGSTKKNYARLNVISLSCTTGIGCFPTALLRAAFILKFLLLNGFTIFSWRSM